MTISISAKEYDAVIFACNQLETEIEAAIDEDFLAIGNESLNALYSIIDKYKEARQKANYFQMCRAEVARMQRNSGLRPRDIDKLTRQVMKRMK